MQISRLRLITFDITDTLLKFKLSPGQQYGEVSKLYGINCNQNEQELSKSFKKTWTKMNLKHPNFGLYSGLGWEKWWQMIVIDTFKNTKINVEDKTLEQIASHLIDLYKVSSCWKLTDGVLGLLSYIRSKKIML